MKRYFLLVFALAVILSVPAAARDNANIILVLDHSGSMKNNYGDVKTYIRDHILTILEKGDFLFFIQFGETADFYYTDVVDDSSISEARKILDESRADQDYTDIGLALETMLYTLKQSHKVNDKSILLFITDGKNAPSPSSKYYEEEYEYQKVFFDRAEYLKESPWKVMKIMVLGIGEDTAAKDLSTILDGEYIEVSSNVNTNLLIDAVGDFLGHLEMFFEPDLGKIRSSDSEVPFIIDSTYDKEQIITITAAGIGDLEMEEEGIWIPVDSAPVLMSPLPLEFRVDPRNPAHGSFYLEIPKGTPRGRYRGRISVETEKSHRLLYTDFLISFRISRSPVFWIIIITGAVLIIAAAGFILVRRFIL